MSEVPPLPEVAGLLTADEARATAEAIAEWQLPSGMIPWFPGGHADAWNHVEAAMALDVGGFRAEAERAYEWLIGLQRPDGAWHQYYVPSADGVAAQRGADVRDRRLLVAQGEVDLVAGQGSRRGRGEGGRTAAG